MSMKIWYQNPTPFSPKLEGIDRFMKENLARAAGEGTKVETHWLKKGFRTVVYPYNFIYNARYAAQAIYEAEQKGYDAGVIGCLADLALREARSIVNIPVTGAYEASLLLACTLGAKFSIITHHKSLIGELTKLARAYGLSDRVTSISDLGLSASELAEITQKGDTEKLIHIFEEVAERAIREHDAEVIIPGCTLVSSVLTAQGIAKIKGVPVVDGVIAAVKMAEVLVDMQRKFGLEVCRGILYSAQPDWQEEIPIEGS